MENHSFHIPLMDGNGKRWASKMKVGDRVKVQVDGKELGYATIKGFSFQDLVHVTFDEGNWMIVHKTSLSEVSE